MNGVPDVDVGGVVHVQGVCVGVEVPVQNQLLNDLLPEQSVHLLSAIEMS